MNLRTKLTANTAVLTAAALLLSAAAVITIRTVSRALRESTEVAARQMQSAGALQADFQQMRAASHAAQIAVTIGLLEKDSPKAGRCGGCHDSGMSDKHLESFRESGRKVLAQLDYLEKLADSPDDVTRITALRDGIAKWQAANSDYFGKSAAGDFDNAHTVVTERIFPLMEQNGKAAAELESHARQTLDETSARAMKHAAQGMAATLAVVFITLGTAAVALVIIHRSGKRLARLVSTLHGSSQGVVDAGRNVTRTSRALAAGVSGQKKALQDTVSESGEIARAARSNTSDAAQADLLVQECAQRSLEARALLDQMLEANEAIYRSSEQIAGIIRIIDEIAFQTNILSLNAAVEASRAGSAGMGFAVVADEVRSLAQRCAGAARETAQLIDDLRRRSSEGRAKVESAAASVHAIAEQTAKVRTLVGSVHTASRNQSQGMERLGSAVNNVEHTNNQTACLAGESAAQASELQQTYDEIGSAIEQLRTLVGT